MTRRIQHCVWTLLCHIVLLTPAVVWAQEDAPETPPQPPDVADAAGEWWVRLGNAEFRSHVLAALANIAAIIAISVIAYFVAVAVIGRAIDRVEKQTEEATRRRRGQQRVVTVLELVRSIIRWVILITAGVWILASAGMDIRPVLAGAGVVGLAVGFGAQNLVRDIVSGFFILLEGQYAVGDYVQIGANFGMVESIGMRVTILKDLDNQRHFIPNGTITQITVYEEPFTNWIVEVPLAEPAQCEPATRVVAELIERLQQQYEHYLVYHEPPRPVCCDDTAFVRLPVAIFPTQEWLVNDEIPAGIKDALAQASIGLREGRTIRVYMDLSRMPEYRYSEDEGEVS